MMTDRVDCLVVSPILLKQRLLARLSRAEFFALAFTLALAGVFAWHQSVLGYVPYDLGNYLNGARGDTSHYYYAYWFLPVFVFLEWLPYVPGFLLWSALNIACLFAASRIFGGKTWAVMLSYQACYCLFQGQITGVIVGGVALLYWGIIHRRWNLAGLGLTVALVKVQLGLMPCLALLGLLPLSWKERTRVLLVPLFFGLLSLVIYPGWVLQLITTLQQAPPDAEGSIALWRWLGPLALLLWLPPLLLRLSRQDRLTCLVAANALALPYFQQTDLLMLFCLPVGWLAFLGNLGYLFVVSKWAALQALAVVPILAYSLVFLRWLSFKRKPNPL